MKVAKKLINAKALGWAVSSVSIKNQLRENSFYDYIFLDDKKIRLQTSSEKKHKTRSITSIHARSLNSL